MPFSRRRLARGDFDGELVAAAVIVATGAMGAAWLRLGLPTPVCAFHAVTGLPCLTCGGTRCLRNLLAGHFAAALAWNPLVFLGAVFAAGFVAYTAIVIKFRLPRLRLRPLTPRAARGWRFAAIALLAANWIYLIFAFHARPEPTVKRGLTVSWSAQ